MSEYALALSDQEVERYKLMAARARVDEARAWQQAGIVAGASVADIGCGPGAALLAMAEVVGPSGRVVGVDADQTAVRTAQQLIGEAGVGWADVVEGRADDSGLEAGSFDVAVARHVLAHNGGREQAIVRHLGELVRPGGCVYVVDVDVTAWRMLDVEPEVVDLVERYTAFHRARGNDPQIGLRLGQLLKGAGLELVEHAGTWMVMLAPVGHRPPAWAAREEMVRDGIATSGDVERWQAALERMDSSATRPTVFLPLFMATARRPG